MVFSTHELQAIGEVQESIRYFRREILTSEELARSLIDTLAWCGATRVVPHCLALAPQARADVERFVTLLVESEYQYVGWAVGPGLSEEKKAELRPRYRAVAEATGAYYHLVDQGSGESLETLAVPDVDLFWVLLKDLDSSDGSICRADGCQRPTVRVSIYCAHHHYERITGKPAPDY
jgi:hypothetical protein